MTIDQEIYTDDFQEVNLTIGGNEWYLLQARVELSTASTPDFVDMVISPTESTVEGLSNPSKPRSEGGLLGRKFVLEIDTELSAGPRSDEKTKIFTGNLANLSSSGQGAWEAIAWDPSHQSFASGEGSGNSGNFLNSTIDISSSVQTPQELLADPVDADPYYATPSATTPYSTKILASNLVDTIIDESPLNSSQVETNFAQKPGVLIGDGVYGGIDRELFFSNEEITVSDALDRIKKSTNSTWWFDADGVFHIGAPVPGNPVDAFDLQFIIETTAGLSTPAWQGVQVIGSSVVSEEGWSKANMNSATPALSTATMKNDGKLDTGKLAEPVFTYRNLEIQTQAEADAAVKSIIKELREQQAEGKVTVIGFPEVRPLDAVVMPDSKIQPMGGERYSVTKVTHKINPSDGFITDIHVGGLTEESSTVLTEDVEESDFTNSFIASNTTEGLAQGDGI